MHFLRFRGCEFDPPQGPGLRHWSFKLKKCWGLTFQNPQMNIRGFFADHRCDHPRYPRNLDVDYLVLPIIGERAFVKYLFFRWGDVEFHNAGGG